jgi:hypothetical protein
VEVLDIVVDVVVNGKELENMNLLLGEEEEEEVVME